MTGNKNHKGNAIIQQIKKDVTNFLKASFLKKKEIKNIRESTSNIFVYTHRRMFSINVPPKWFIIHIPGSVLNIDISHDKKSLLKLAVFIGLAVLSSKFVDNINEYPIKKIAKIIRKILKFCFHLIIGFLLLMFFENRLGKSFETIDKSDSISKHINKKNKSNKFASLILEELKDFRKFDIPNTSIEKLFKQKNEIRKRKIAGIIRK